MCHDLTDSPHRSSDIFETVPIKSSNEQCLSFALPSRISTAAAFFSHLAGSRILIQDNSHLKGIKTSWGNKALYYVYEPPFESVRCFQDLVDLGIVIAGRKEVWIRSETGRNPPKTANITPRGFPVPKDVNPRRRRLGKFLCGCSVLPA